MQQFLILVVLRLLEQLLERGPVSRLMVHHQVVQHECAEIEALAHICAGGQHLQSRKPLAAMDERCEPCERHLVHDA